MSDHLSKWIISVPTSVSLLTCYVSMCSSVKLDRLSMTSRGRNKVGISSNFVRLRDINLKYNLLHKCRPYWSDHNRVDKSSVKQMTRNSLRSIHLVYNPCFRIHPVDGCVSTKWTHVCTVVRVLKYLCTLFHVHALFGCNCVEKGNFVVQIRDVKVNKHGRSPYESKLRRTYFMCITFMIVSCLSIWDVCFRFRNVLQVFLFRY